MPPALSGVAFKSQPVRQIGLPFSMYSPDTVAIASFVDFARTTRNVDRLCGRLLFIRARMGVQTDLLALG